MVFHIFSLYLKLNGFRIPAHREFIHICITTKTQFNYTALYPWKRVYQPNATKKLTTKVKCIFRAVSFPQSFFPLKKLLLSLKFSWGKFLFWRGKLYSLVWGRLFGFNFWFVFVLIIFFLGFFFAGKLNSFVCAQLLLSFNYLCFYVKQFVYILIMVDFPIKISI